MKLEGAAERDHALPQQRLGLVLSATMQRPWTAPEQAGAQGLRVMILEGAAERDHALPQQRLGLVHAHGQRLNRQRHRGFEL